MQSKPTLVLDARKAFDSGIGTYIRNLIPYLNQEFELSLIGKQSDLNLFGCKVLDTNSKPYSISDFYLPTLLAGKPDIFWTPHFNFPLFTPRAKLNVATLHDLYHKSHWNILSFKQKVIYNVFLNNIKREADLVFTISDFTRKEIAKFYPDILPKTSLIHLGVDFNVFKRQTQKLHPLIRQEYNLPEKYILFVGNLKPNKNVIMLLKAYKLWIGSNESPDVSLVITGKNTGFRIGDNEAVDFINQNGLERHVHFTGFVNEEHLPLLYQNAWLFAFPSLYEGFGLPPLEAMACGCPVICSTSASIPEVCQDNATYFDANSPEELKDLLVKINSDKSVFNKKAELAADWVHKYQWSLTAEKHIRMLKDSLAVKS